MNLPDNYLPFLLTQPPPLLVQILSSVSFPREETDSHQDLGFTLSVWKHTAAGCIKTFRVHSTHAVFHLMSIYGSLNFSFLGSFGSFLVNFNKQNI